MKEVTKSQFKWLYEKYFKRFDIKFGKPWYKTCQKRQRSNRGKYYVQDKFADIVEKQNIE